MDVLTDDLKYDGKHSYEDNIMKVEDAWKEYHDRIAILGGIDVNFIITKSEKDVYRRSREMLELTADEGSFALGTGNSVPEYLPMEKYFTMLRAAWEFQV